MLGATESVERRSIGPTEAIYRQLYPHLIQLAREFQQVQTDLMQL